MIVSHVATHAVTLLSSSSLAAAVDPSPEIIATYDDAIRTALQGLADSFLWKLIVSSIVVGVGVLCEGPEVWHEISPFAQKLLFKLGFLKKKRLVLSREMPPWIKILGFIGWMIVVFGVIGEGIFEGLQNAAEEEVQAFDEILISSAQRESSAANERAGYANERAGQLEKDAGQLRKDEADARLETVRLEAQIQPRLLTLAEQTKIGKACAHLYLYGTQKRIVIGSYAMDTEGQALASQIGDALVSGGLYLHDMRGATFEAGNALERGIIVSSPPEDMQFANCFESVLVHIGHLKDVRINPEVHFGSPVMSLSGVTIFRGNAVSSPAGPSAPGSAVAIFVGVKPSELKQNP